jgi:hypothetical protein
MLLHATESPSAAAVKPLPKNLQPSSIKRTYEDIASRSRVSSEWVCTEKSSDEQTTGQCIAKMASSSHVDMLFMGRQSNLT